MLNLGWPKGTRGSIYIKKLYPSLGFAERGVEEWGKVYLSSGSLRSPEVKHNSPPSATPVNINVNYTININDYYTNNINDNYTNNINVNYTDNINDYYTDQDY